MTDCAEAFFRAKVLKEEYDQKFGKWLDLCDKFSSSNRKEMLALSMDVERALKKLDDASWELSRILGKLDGSPDNLVARVPA